MFSQISVTFVVVGDWRRLLWRKVMGSALCHLKIIAWAWKRRKGSGIMRLNPAWSPKPPNNFCHFCFLFSQCLVCPCIIFLNFPPEPQRWEIPFLWNRWFCGQRCQYVFSHGPFIPLGLLTRLLHVAGSRRNAASCPLGLGLPAPKGWAQGIGLAFLLRASHQFSQDLWECNYWNRLKFVV